MKLVLWVLVAGAVFLVAALLLPGVVLGVALAGTGPVPPGPATPAAGPFGLDGIPPSMQAVYRTAAAVCPGLSWTTLGAIGTIESDNGQSSEPGVHSGQNPAGAEGPMQFEVATFLQFDHPVPPGGVTPPSPYDPVDAAYAAARLLCADGAAGGRDLPAAIYAYNHSTALRSRRTPARSPVGSCAFNRRAFNRGPGRRRVRG